MKTDEQSKSKLECIKRTFALACYYSLTADGEFDTQKKEHAAQLLTLILLDIERTIYGDSLEEDVTIANDSDEMGIEIVQLLEMMEELDSYAANRPELLKMIQEQRQIAQTFKDPVWVYYRGKELRLMNIEELKTLFYKLGFSDNDSAEIIESSGPESQEFFDYILERVLNAQEGTEVDMSKPFVDEFAKLVTKFCIITALDADGVSAFDEVKSKTKLAIDEVGRALGIEIPLAQSLVKSSENRFNEFKVYTERFHSIIQTCLCVAHYVGGADGKFDMNEKEIAGNLEPFEDQLNAALASNKIWGVDLWGGNRMLKEAIYGAGKKFKEADWFPQIKKRIEQARDLENPLINPQYLEKLTWAELQEIIRFDINVPIREDIDEADHLEASEKLSYLRDIIYKYIPSFFDQFKDIILSYAMFISLASSGFLGFNRINKKELKAINEIAEALGAGSIDEEFIEKSKRDFKNWMEIKKFREKLLRHLLRS